MRSILHLALLAWLAVLGGASPAARAQGSVPHRQIPPTVLAELRMVENRFELALAADCHSQRCFSKGCTYVDHAVVDRPVGGSMPGLDQETAPGTIVPQEFLTRASCSFAHEDSVTPEEAEALEKRLRSKVSSGFVGVSISRQLLLPLPAGLQEAPMEPVPEVEAEAVAPAVVAPESWTAGVAARELWTSLLPHFAWMIAVVLVTVAATVLFWAWRRMGRESIEERALLAQMLRSDPEGDAAAAEEKTATHSEEEAAFVAQQAAIWDQRLATADSELPDRELQALIRELLRARDMPLLAKAVLRFPESFLATFPAGGDIASSKLELADYLKSVDVSTLPSDGDFFRSLNRHARSASLAAQSDAQLVRSLREDFGAAGLVTLVGELPARAGALLFALAPAEEQHEMVRLLSTRQMVQLGEQLLRSNRMDEAETAYLFEVLRAARHNKPLPMKPPLTEVSDRGSAFDAAGALSVLLPRIPAEQRAALFRASIRQFQDSLPAWHRGILVADMLFALSDEARADMLLEVDVERLAAWLSVQDPDARARVLDGLPSALRSSVLASSTFSSRARQLVLAESARRDLARGFQHQLAQAGVPFERVVQPHASADA